MVRSRMPHLVHAQRPAGLIAVDAGLCPPDLIRAAQPYPSFPHYPLALAPLNRKPSPHPLTPAPPTCVTQVIQRGGLQRCRQRGQALDGTLAHTRPALVQLRQQRLQWMRKRGATTRSNNGAPWHKLPWSFVPGARQHPAINPAGTTPGKREPAHAAEPPSSRGPHPPIHPCPPRRPTFFSPSGSGSREP